MARLPAPRRHAEALFELASERGKEEGVLDNLKSGREVLTHPLLLSLFENPKVSLDEKKKILKRVIPDMEDIFEKFLLFLVDKGRMRLLPGIASEYERIFNEKRGIEYAEVITAVSLDEDMEERIKRRLSELFGKEIYISKRVDPGIIGGMVVRVGDKLIDGSIRMRLEEMRKSLSG